ncbi:MAG: metallophosphoesterase [Deltaproteobacteria bacterium]
MANWYTSDPHFFHANIIGHCARPFASVDAMNAALIANFACVGADDDLWIIGDFAFGPGAREVGALARIFDALPGRKHLIFGNHDHSAVKALPWLTARNLVELKDDGQHLTLCHYPMITFNNARKGALQLFGHVHSDWRGTRNSVNVGVDVWDFLPVQIADIRARAKTLPVNKHWADVEHGAEDVPEHLA